MEPQSRLTLERPHLWARALDLAEAQTGYRYLPKRPLADGTISACGGSFIYPNGLPKDTPPKPLTPEELEEQRRRDEETRQRREREEAEREIKDLEAEIERLKDELGNLSWQNPNYYATIARLEEAIRRAEERLGGLRAAPSVLVPEGAVEWLLHEVGHFVAASPAERQLPNYGLTQLETGHDAEREWQAWAFEEIILAPFGHARLFAPREHRGGVGFSRDAIPAAAFRHIERQMFTLGMDAERWRSVVAEWVAWERRRNRSFGLT